MGKRKKAGCTSSKKIKTKDGKIKKTTPTLFSDKSYRCDICYKEFTNRSNMISHQNVHSTETPFSCPQCPYRGKTKKYLARHIRKVHNEVKTHKCSYCGKLFLHQSGLNVHAMVHTGEKPHSCNVCGKKFRVTYSLNSHMLIHTNEKPFECSFCDYACRDSSTLRKHQNKHMGLEKIYECKICTKGYKNRAALKIHISETHLDIDMRKFPCHYCNKAFKNNANRQTHIKSVHERSLSCRCSVCGFKLSNKNNLSAHLRTHLRERPFRCTHPECTKTFKDKNSLTKHRVIHNPDLHHPCRYCGRKFARKTHVQRHERVMHKERKKNVQCDYCGSKFYSKNYLLKHIQTKHVYKQKFKYICDMCGLITYNKPSIVMHIKYGHSNDHDLQCKICDTKKVYKRHMYLKLHYWKTHNIRYKITRKSTHTKANMKAKDEQSVQIKVEPIEAESYEEIQLLEVNKQENEDETDYESLDYSKRVMSEDIAKSVLSAKTEGNEIEFDDFFIRHVFPKQEEKEDGAKNSEVNEEANEYVKQRVKKMLVRTRKLEKAKALRKKRIIEEKRQKEEDLKEAKLKAEKERQEIIELRRVREMYNERMKAAVAREKGKKERIKIKYLKNRPKNLMTISESLTDNYDKTDAENADSTEKNTKTSDLNLSDNDKDQENDKTSDIHLSDDDITHENDSNIKNTDLNPSDVDIINKNYKTTASSSGSANIPEETFNKDTLSSNDSTETENKSLSNEDTNVDDLSLNTDLINDINKQIEENIMLTEKRIFSRSIITNTENKDENGSNEDGSSDEWFKSEEQNDKNQEENRLKSCYEIIDHMELTDQQNDFNKSLNIDKQIEENNANNDNTGNKLLETSVNDENNAIYDNTGNKLLETSVNVENNADNKILENRVNIENNANDDITDNKSLENSVNVENTELHKSANDNQEMIENYTIDEPLLERRVKSKTKYKEFDTDDDYDDESLTNDEDINEKAKKMEFKTFQCYVCFKLYQTKEQLIDHCQEHFDICNERTLTKCPICAHVSNKSLSDHMKKKHDVNIKIPFNKLKNRGSKEGSKYCYDVDGTVVEVIPSIKILNKVASDDIDKKRREKNDKTIAKTKLVKKGDEWIVEKELINIQFEEIPELTDMELYKLKVTENDVDRLGQLSYLAKKKGLKMMFPCFNCDKVCQNFSALKLHKRRHEDNPKPFKPRVSKQLKSKEVKKKIKLDTANRTALPKPILHKHKCDDKLKEFYETNIRGGDIEFWQFLKIFNKMDRENVNDFKDLEERSDFGNHLDYYKDVEGNDE